MRKGWSAIWSPHPQLRGKERTVNENGSNAFVYCSLSIRKLYSMDTILQILFIKKKKKVLPSSKHLKGALF